MSLIKRAQEDWRRLSSDLNGFGVAIIFESPTGEIVTVNGLHTKHSVQWDESGMKVNVPNAHISVSEKLLIEQYYPVRNDENKVDLKRHKVSVMDSNDMMQTYMIDEAWPDQTVGMIVCILGNFSETGSS